jgi:hypothetical protein
MLALAKVLTSIRNADSEVRSLLDRYEAGGISFGRLMEQLKALSVVH